MREYLSLYNNNFNFITREYCADTNPKINSGWSSIDRTFKKTIFYGNDTKELVQKYNPEIVEEDIYNNFNKQFLSKKSRLWYDHFYSVYGYYGNSKSINIPVKLNGIYKLYEIDLSVCSLSDTVEEIYISLPHDIEDNALHYSHWLFNNNKLFGFTYDQLKETNIERIIIPKDMYLFYQKECDAININDIISIEYYDINRNEV